MSLSEVFPGREDEAAGVIGANGLGISGDAYNYSTDMARSFKAMMLAEVEMSEVVARMGHMDSADPEYRILKIRLSRLNSSYFLLKKYREARFNENMAEAA